MSASVSLPAPEGQNHDREDAVMEDPEGLTNGHLETGTNPTELPPATVAVEVAAVDDDAMDTTPDNAQGLVLPNGSADTQEPIGDSPSSPAPNGVTQEGVDGNSQQNPPVDGTENTVGLFLTPPNSLAC